MTGLNIGPDDQLAVGLHPHRGIHVVAHHPTTQIFARRIPHHLTTTAGHQQALHIHIVHTGDINRTGGAHRAIGVAGAGNHQFRRRMNNQASSL